MSQAGILEDGLQAGNLRVDSHQMARLRSVKDFVVDVVGEVVAEIVGPLVVLAGAVAAVAVGIKRSKN